MYVYKQTSMWVHTPLELKILPDFGLKFFGLNSCGWTRQLKELFTGPQGAGEKKHFPFYIIYSTLDSLFIYILYIFMPFLTLKNFNFRRAQGRRQETFWERDRQPKPSNEPVSLLLLIDWWQSEQKSLPKSGE